VLVLAEKQELHEGVVSKLQPLVEPLPRDAQDLREEPRL
jgi:hypothetical protein